MNRLATIPTMSAKVAYLKLITLIVQAAKINNNIGRERSRGRAFILLNVRTIKSNNVQLSIIFMEITNE